MQTLRQDAQAIIDKALADALPDSAVRRALEQFQKPEGRLVLIAAGKAAWQMAKAAYDVLGTAITSGAVITKYDHVKGPIGALELFEAGHPVPDENSYRATSRALELVSGLSERDTVLFLLSGGGSALFESPLVPAEEMADVTKQLLACGADIVEMNTLRKRLSAVKGGRFAERCLPAKVFSIVLSDILGDPLDMIASGPAYPDSSTCAQALEVVRKYGLRLSDARAGASGAGDAEDAHERRDPHHRQRPPALRLRRADGPGARLHARHPDGEPALHRARRGQLPGLHRAVPPGQQSLARLHRRRRDRRPSDRPRSWRPQSGDRAFRRAGDRRSARYRRLLLWLRRHRRPDRRRGRLLRRRYLRGAGGKGHFDPRRAAG